MPAIPPGVYQRKRQDGKVVYKVKVYDRRTKRGRWVGTFGDLDEAKAAKREAESLPRSRRRIAIGVYYERWLTIHPRSRESTHRTYRHAVRSFVDDFNAKRFDEIDRVAALEWAAGHPVSHTDAVRVMFSDAVNDGVASYNPFANLRRRRSRGRADLFVIGTRELEYLADTALQVWGAGMGTTVRAMILVAANTGLRPAELFALEYGAIDRARSEILISHQLDSSAQAQLPKNGQPRRIVLLSATADALLSMPRAVNSPLLFRTARGCAFNQAKWAYYWHPVRAAFGTPDMDFYELRHYCATLLLAQGLRPSDVAVQLGHTDGGALVMKLYGHPAEDDARTRIKLADASGLTPLPALVKVQPAGVGRGADDGP
jgi:integrase